MTRITNTEIMERLNAISRRLDEIQDQQEKQPNEEKIRAITRQEAHDVVTRDMDFYERQFDERDTKMLKRFEALVTEVQATLQATMARASEIAKENVEFRDSLRDLEINIKRDMRDMFSGYVEIPRNNTASINRLSESVEQLENVLTSRQGAQSSFNARIASELFLITGADVLSQSPTKHAATMLQRLETQEDETRILNANIAKMNTELKAYTEQKLEETKYHIISEVNKPSALMRWWEGVMPAKARRVLASKAVARGLMGLVSIVLTGLGLEGAGQILTALLNSP